MFCRSAGDPAPFEIGEGAFLNHVVSRHPDHKSHYHCGCDDISADYESSMRSEIHQFISLSSLGLGQHQDTHAPAHDLVAHGGKVQADEQQTKGDRHDCQRN